MMRIQVNLHGASKTPAAVIDFRDQAHPFVTFDIVDDGGNLVSCFFASKEQLVDWLADAHAAACALPDPVTLPDPVALPA